MEHIKKKYVLFIIPLLIVLGACTIFFAFNKEEKATINIQEVLKSEDYSYLPDVAKEFIIEAYEETGNVILTEENKEDNKPYLNPEYVEYLSLTDNQKAEVDVIPNVYLMDYSIADSIESEIDEGTIPSSYDLRNVNGNNYITNLKNQGTMGVCWAFTSTEIAESKLMVDNNTPGSTLNFSVRQLDYAISTDGISNASNEHGLRTVGSGGNFLYASYALANGVSLINDTYWPFDTSTTTKKYHEVFNDTRSLYEINSSVDLPVLNISTLGTSTSDVNKKNTYLNYIKERIMSDGGAYVSTEGPGYSCSASYNGTTIVRVDSSCSQNNAHAMQVIGWDDNYTYKYCQNGSSHTTWTSSCSSANTVSGTGAWILRNSWGSSYSYLYLAYDSNDDTFSFITDMESITWDHSYHTSMLNGGSMYISSSSNVLYSRNTSNTEKVDKVKFYAYSTDGSYDVTLCTNGTSSCSVVGSTTVSYPGFVTVDLSSKNIKLTNDTFTVQVSSSSSSNHIIGSLAVFTNESVTTPTIYTPTIESESKYQFTFMSYTRNIPDGSNITYKLYNSSGTDVTSYMSVTNNVVTLDKVINYVSLSTSLTDGKYTLKATYGSTTVSSDLILYASGTYQGSGTSSDPYLIYTFSQLRNIGNYSTKYFKLMADLDLTSYYGNFTSISSFSGTLDGNGHTISNLTSPLFNSISGSSSGTATIKNLTLKNSVISSSTNAGILANKLGDNGYAVKISNINIVGGSVTSTNYAGSLIGYITVTSSNKITIDGIYNSATVNGTNASGLLGVLYTSNTTNKYYVTVKNIQNVGVNKGKVKSGYIIGGTEGVVPYISNIIVSGPISADATDYHSVIGYYSNSALITSNIKNGYYANGTNPFVIPTDYTSTLTKKSPWSLTASSSISSWTDYSSYWETRSSDSVSRMVSLKNANYEYTAFKTISFKSGEDNCVSIYDYLTPNIEAAKQLSFSSNDTAAVKINSSGTMCGYTAGTTSIRVKSYYDGFNADVPITIIDENAVNIYFNANGGTGTMDTQVAIKGNSFTIPANKFTRAGYTFSKWNTKADGSGTSYAAGGTISSVSGKTTLYAQWTAGTYTISFDLNGVTGTAISSISAKYGSTITIPNNTNKKTGYVFSSWNTKKDGTGATYSPGSMTSNFTANTTLYAIYTPITYTLKYNYNFNDLTYSESVTYGSSYKISALKYYQNLKFKGWNTKKDGTGTYYYTGSSNSNLSTTNGATVNLYAIWDTAKVINGTTYTYTTTDGLLTNVSNNTNLTSYISTLNVASGFTTKTFRNGNELGNNDIIGTGTITYIYDSNSNVIFSCINVIRGDVNGDGKVNSADYISIRKHIMNTTKITSTYQVKGADANLDGKISSADYVKIRKFIMNGGTF